MVINTYKREDGTRVRVDINLYTGWSYNHLNITLSFAEAGKRKFKPVFDSEDYRYRCASMKEREDIRRNETMKYISEDELNECINMYFEVIKKDIKLNFN